MIEISQREYGFGTRQKRLARHGVSGFLQVVVLQCSASFCGGQDPRYLCHPPSLALHHSRTLLARSSSANIHRGTPLNQMMTAMRKAFQWLYRTTKKCFKWIFLLTLPLTVMPIISGGVNGLCYTLWTKNIVDSHVDAFLNGMKDVANDWGPSEMTFRAYQDSNNDFHVLRLNDNDWASKLGFVLPQQYSGSSSI
jgi:hypothetical protein